MKLSRFHDDLYWINGREVIPGGVEPDGVSFAFSTRVEAEVLPTGKGRPACVLSRADSAKGTLSSDSSDVETFDATLTFSYSAVAGSDCELWVGGPDTRRRPPLLDVLRPHRQPHGRSARTKRRRLNPAR